MIIEKRRDAMAEPLYSPCVGVCTFDDAQTYCIGCGRTTDDIRNWSSYTAEQRQRAAFKAAQRIGAECARS